jgi:mannose-6-phosphate isomerase
MQTIAPFRLAAYFRPRPWGFVDLRPWYDFESPDEPIGEVWLTGEMCAAETGEFAGLTLKTITEQHRAALLGEAEAAGDFPLLVKVLFPREKLSVQVHPDDALAQRYGFPRGKTECWYALDAADGASVALGLKPGTTHDQVRAAIENSTLEQYLEWLPVQKNDMIYVDAGTVHAIAPGAVLLEVQQTSDLTYRMYDYGRPRELHVDQSIAATRIRTSAGKRPPIPAGDHFVLIDEHYFRIERWPLSPGRASEALTGPSPSVQMLFCSSGPVEISGIGFDPFRLESRQLAVIPAETPINLSSEIAAEIIRIKPCAV